MLTAPAAKDDPAPIIDDTHDPKLESWVESANDPSTDFPIQNLPFVDFSLKDDEDGDSGPGGVIIGDRVLGLPREPAVDRGVPFRELKVGTQTA